MKFSTFNEFIISFNIYFSLILIVVWILFFFFILKNNYSRLISILFLYISPLTTMLILGQSGFRFQIVIALEFISLIGMLVIYLKNRTWQKKGRFIIYFFILVMLCSTIFPFFLFQISVIDNVALLRRFSYNILPALNAILFLIAIHKTCSNTDVFITKLAKFFQAYGFIIIIEVLFSLISGMSSLYSQSFYGNNQLITFLGGGPDSIVRIMVISILSSFYLFQIDKKRFKFFTFLSFAIIIIFLAFSRTGYLLLIIALFLIFTRITVNWRTWTIFFLLVIIMAIIVNSIDLLQVIKINKGSELNSLNTWGQRVDLLISAKEMITKNYQDIFWGVGYKNYLSFVEKQGGVVVSGIYYLNRSFENKYIEFIIETGFLGFIFILYFIITCISTIINSFFIKDTHLFLMSTILIVLLIGSMVVNMDWIMFYLFILIIIKNHIKGYPKHYRKNLLRFSVL